MPAYSMDMHIKLESGSELGGQNWLTVGYPGADRWGICSSNVGIYGLKGQFSYSEKLGYEGTTFYKEGSSGDVILRLAIFRGGVIDADSWSVGKGGEGEWLITPLPGVARKFQWTIRKIDRDSDP